MPLIDLVRRDEPATGRFVVSGDGGRRLKIPRIASLLAGPTGRASSPAEATTGWLKALVPRDSPELEPVRLLGDAWRSPVPATVHTGRHFDVVAVPEDLAAEAWHRLRLLEVPCGAVFASDGRWNFFVPTRSGDLPWPETVNHLTHSSVCLPPRSVRDGSHGLWWVSRPSSGLFVDPIALVAALEAVISSRSGPCPAAEASTSCPGECLSPPARSYGA